MTENDTSNVLYVNVFAWTTRLVVDKNDFEVYLEALGRELEVRKFKEAVRIMVVGGGFMMVRGNRKATEDIDAVLLDLPEMTAQAEEAREFVKAVKAVARKHHIKQIWLNDTVSAFITEFAILPQVRLWKEFGKLHVYFPPDEYILCLKLMTYRPKDFRDIQFLLEELQVETAEAAQALLDHYIPDKRWQEHYMIADTLDELF